MADMIDVGSMRVPAGFFLNRRDGEREGTAFVGGRRSIGSDRELRLVHPRCAASDLKEAILETIRGARCKLFVVSFILTDEEIVSALARKARELRGGVYVVTSLDEDQLERELKDASVDTESSAAMRQAARERLTKQGVWLRGAPGCHAKYVVADDRVALICTSNFEVYPLSRGGEVGLLVTDQSECRRLARQFTRIWYNRACWEMAPGPSHTIAARRPATAPCTVPMADGVSASQVIWTDQDEHLILRAFREISSSARDELLIATWDASGLAEKPALVLEPLREAVDRGVRCHMLTRIRNRIPRSRENMQRLAEIGVRIYADPSNHAKGVVADRTLGALFSANLDCRHGLDNGIEVGITLPPGPALVDFTEYLDQSMKLAPTRFDPSPTHRDLSEGLLSQSLGRWPLPLSISLRTTAEDWSRFAASLRDQLILFESHVGEDGIRLMAGRDRFTLRGDCSGCYTLASHSKESESSSTILDSWLFGERCAGDSRGICSGTFLRLDTEGLTSHRLSSVGPTR